MCSRGFQSPIDLTEQPDTRLRLIRATYLNIFSKTGDIKYILFIILQKSLMTETATTPLTGKALLQKVKELEHLRRRETAKLCGYYSTTKNQQIRVNLTSFYNAVLAAKGIPLSQEGRKDGRGREATYRAIVHKNGQIVIGTTYTESMGLIPGDKFDIKLGYKHIHLIQVDSDRTLDENNGSLEEAEADNSED